MRYKKINLHELLPYSLDPLPLLLANSQGSLIKTHKVNLRYAIEILPAQDLN